MSGIYQVYTMIINFLGFPDALPGGQCCAPQLMHAQPTEPRSGLMSQAVCAAGCVPDADNSATPTPSRCEVRSLAQCAPVGGRATASKLTVDPSLTCGIVGWRASMRTPRGWDSGYGPIIIPAMPSHILPRLCSLFLLSA